MSASFKDALAFGPKLIEGLEVIQRMTGVGGKTAEEALAAIAVLASSLLDGASGKVTHAEVDDAISSTDKTFQASNAVIDAEIDARFPK